MRLRILLASLLLPVLAHAAGPLDDALTRLHADDILVSDAAVEEIVAFGADAVEPLLDRLDHESRDVRAGAIRGLGLLGDPRAAAPIADVLVRSLENTEPDTMEDRYLRILAIQALGRIGDPSWIDVLLRAAGGDDFERAHSGIALFLLGEESGYDRVRACLADSAVAIRSLAAGGLGESEDSSARELLLGAVGDDSWVVRDAAYRGLARWRDDGAVRDALSRGAKDTSWYVRQTVAEVSAAGNTAPGDGDR